MDITDIPFSRKNVSIFVYRFFSLAMMYLSCKIWHALFFLKPMSQLYIRPGCKSKRAVYLLELHDCISLIVLAALARAVSSLDIPENNRNRGLCVSLFYATYIPYRPPEFPRNPTGRLCL